MDTKAFLKEIRSIIREEIDYALDKRLSESKRKPVQETIDHGVSLYKQAVKGVSKPSQKTQKKPITGGKYNGVNDILEETRRSLQENYSVEDYDGGREMFFDSNSLNAFAGNRMAGINATPAGVNPSEIAPEVAQALTRDYSALMAKINEKKGR